MNDASLIEYRPSRRPVSSPVCSVCIANYNGISTIGKCLESVRQQDCDFEVEIIVHDDASSDLSAAYIEQHYPEASLILSKKNCGFCVSNNRMVEQARGKYILLLNNDAALFPDALRQLYEHAEKQSISGILGLPQYRMDDGSLLDCGSLLDPFLNVVPNLKRSQRYVGMVTGACLWLPRRLWCELGGFPNWFQILAEDLHLCCKARLWSYPVEVLQVSGFRHCVGNALGGGKTTARKRLQTTFHRRFMSERNKMLVMLTCYPTWLLCMLFPLHLLLFWAEGIAITLAQRDWRLWRDIYWRSTCDVWRIRCLWQDERRKAQARRRVSMRTFLAPHVWMPYKWQMVWKHGLPRVEQN